MASVVIGGLAMVVPSGEAAAAPIAAGVSCPAGETLIVSTGQTTDALGVTRYTYRAVPGLVAKVPARGLTASQVTPAMIKDLGVPATPALTGARGRRAIALESRTAPRYCLSPPSPEPSPAAGKRPALGAVAPRSQVGVTYNESWAGYRMSSAQFGAPISNAVGNFPLTTAAVPKDGAQTDEWVGVGDFPSYKGLIQAGVRTYTPSGGARQLLPFFEYINNGTGCCKFMALGSAKAGDEMAVHVFYSSGNSACFQVADTTSDTYPVNTCMTVATPEDTSSAEWFIEDAMPGGLYLEDLGTLSWSHMAVSEQDGTSPPFHSPFNYNYYNDTIESQNETKLPTCASGLIIAYPSNPGGTSTYGTMRMNINGTNGCTAG